MSYNDLPPGKELPHDIYVAIEIPANHAPIKYEIDKASGLMKVDRPQKYSSLPPALYGFIPQTYCDERIRALANDKKVTSGDHDPLDICVITERNIGSNGFLVRARTIGGLRLIDDHEIKSSLAAEHPYREWLDSQQFHLDELPQGPYIRMPHHRVVLRRVLRVQFLG